MTTGVAAVAGLPRRTSRQTCAPGRAVEVPVQVLVPDCEAVVTGELVRELSALPGWSFETVADSGHSLYRDQPALVVERAVAMSS
jgi:hypothetical protein